MYYEHCVGLMTVLAWREFACCDVLGWRAAFS